MEPPIPPAPQVHPKLDEVGALRALVHAVQTRIVGGLLLALPIVLTFWIIYSLYTTLKRVILDPMARVVRYFVGDYGTNAASRFWWDQVAAPLIAIVAVLTLLYFLGLIVRSRLRHAIDWVMLRVPVVTTIYKALNNVFQSLGDPSQGSRFQRVVLVEFPHPGARSLGFVTNSLRDVKTGRKILCVCVLTGVVPPAGFTIFVPEESVTDLDWSVNQTLQAILSGGITVPASIRYFDGPRLDAATGPIIDPLGHPIARPDPAP